MLEKIRGPVDPRSCQSRPTICWGYYDLNIFHQTLIPVVFPCDDSGSRVHIGHHIEQDLPSGIRDGESSNGY